MINCDVDRQIDSRLDKLKDSGSSNEEKGGKESCRGTMKKKRIVEEWGDETRNAEEDETRQGKKRRDEDT